MSEYYNNKSLLQRVAEWDFDMTDIGNWFANTAHYWGDKYGIFAYLGVFALVVIALLAFPLTSKPTSLIVASAIRALSSGITLVFIGTILWLLNLLKDLGISRARTMIDTVKNINSKKTT